MAKRIIKKGVIADLEKAPDGATQLVKLFDSEEVLKKKLKLASDVTIGE